LPVTFWTMTAAVFAISGIFPFAGFFSKDAILAATFTAPHGGKALWFVGLVTAGLTSFYMFRLWYMTFFGESRSTETAGHHGSHGVHESPWIMLLPLVILAILSTVGGWIGWPTALGGSDWIGHFLDPVFGVSATAQPIAADFTLERILSGVSLLVAVLGWFVADRMYRRKPLPAGQGGEGRQPFYQMLWHKYWVDEVYAGLIVWPILVLSKNILQRSIEFGVIDGTNTAWITIARETSVGIRRMQSGNIRSYAGWLAAGAAALLIVVLYFAHLH
ncbi:MAG: NADH-quinone oxidoreductase subunit L, partial [Acidobacteriaceae bacterium]